MQHAFSQAQRITFELKGRWYGSYGSACCPAHGDNNPSLTLADGPDGKLLAHCKAGCTFLDVLEALRGLGVVAGSVRTPETDHAEVVRQNAARRQEAEKKERQAKAVWNEAKQIYGTIAESYLRNRGIFCELPASLRFNPACWHPTAQRLPALIARVDGAERFAVHRTYMLPNGMGKTQVAPNKAMLGSTIGGAVRLTEGGESLVVAEGIETALSLACGLLRAPATIWAALSASGMAGLHLPALPGRLTVATDGDEAGRSAGHRLAERATALGWAVSILAAPDACDWNDMLTTNGCAQ